MQPADDTNRLPIARQQASSLRVEDQDAHRRRVHEGFEVCLGPKLVAVPARVGDGQCRLGGEHDKGRFVFRRELPAALLLGEIDIAETLVQITDGSSQEGLHRRMAFGKADRPGVAGDIRQSQRLLDLVQVLEESQTLGQFPEPRALFGGDAGGDEGLYFPGVGEGHQRAVASPGERTGAVYDLLQDGGEFEAFVDAKAGLAHPGQTVAERVNLSPHPAGFLEARIPPGEGLEFLCDTLMHGANHLNISETLSALNSPTRRGAIRSRTSSRPGRPPRPAGTPWSPSCPLRWPRTYPCRARLQGSCPPSPCGSGL